MSAKDALILALQARVAEQQLKNKEMTPLYEIGKRLHVQVTFENNQLVIIGPFPESPLLFKREDYPKQWHIHIDECFSLTCTYREPSTHIAIIIHTRGQLQFSVHSERLQCVHVLHLLPEPIGEIWGTLGNAMTAWDAIAEP